MIVGLEERRDEEVRLSSASPGALNTCRGDQSTCLFAASCPDTPSFVCFQGFTYVLHEGECCGRCLPSACEVVTGSPRGDSQSQWKSVGLGPAGWAGGRGPGEPHPGSRAGLGFDKADAHSLPFALPMASLM